VIVLCVLDILVLGVLLGLWPELERFVPRSRGSLRAGLRPSPVDDCPSRRQVAIADLPPSCNRGIRRSHRAVQAFRHRAWERRRRGRCAPRVSAPRRGVHRCGILRRTGVRSTDRLGVRTRADAIARATTLGTLEQTQSPM
jgi:hypothetical protein